MNERAMNVVRVVVMYTLSQHSMARLDVNNASVNLRYMIREEKGLHSARWREMMNRSRWRMTDR